MDLRQNSSGLKHYLLLAALTVCISCIFRDTAFADNPGVLIFPVVIWPTGIFCLTLTVIFCITLRSKLKKGTLCGSTAKFPTTVMMLSFLTAVAFPLLTRVLDSGFGANASTETILITLAPVEAPAITAILLAVKLKRLRQK